MYYLESIKLLQQEHKRFVSVIAEVVALVLSEIRQFSNQVKIRLISQSAKGISIVLQKWLRYFNGTAIFAFIISALLVFSNNFDLDSNDSDSVILLSFGLSL